MAISITHAPTFIDHHFLNLIQDLLQIQPSRTSLLNLTTAHDTIDMFSNTL